jgi:hypothetical protein
MLILSALAVAAAAALDFVEGLAADLAEVC